MTSSVLPVATRVSLGFGIEFLKTLNGIAQSKHSGISPEIIEYIHNTDMNMPHFDFLNK